MDARTIRRITAVALGVITVLAPGASGAQSTVPPDLLRTVGAYVERYFSAVQSIVGTETVTVQPVGRDLSGEGRMRRMVYELRLDWAPGEAAIVARNLLTVDGRPPRPADEPRCLGPRHASPEPLEFLRPDKQAEFVFSDGGPARVDGRDARVIRFESRVLEPATASWRDGCGSVTPGGMRGRVWIDPVSSEVLRLDSGLMRQFDVQVPREQPWTEGARTVTYERLDTSIRYRPFRFADPEAVILLPASVETLAISRNAASLRTRYNYTDYRRFVTGGRLVQ